MSVCIPNACLVLIEVRRDCVMFFITQGINSCEPESMCWKLNLSHL